jgi:hypothetical protein
MDQRGSMSSINTIYSTCQGNFITVSWFEDQTKAPLDQSPALY